MDHHTVLDKIEKHFEEYGKEACDLATSTFWRMIEMDLSDLNLVFEAIQNSMGHLEDAIEYYTFIHTSERKAINDSLEDLAESFSYLDMDFDQPIDNDSKVPNSSKDILKEMEADPDLVSDSIFDPFVEKCKDTNLFYKEPVAIMNSNTNLYVGLKEQNVLVALPHFSAENDLLYFVNANDQSKDGIVKSGDTVFIYSSRVHRKLVLSPNVNRFEVENGYYQKNYATFTIYGQCHVGENITTNQSIYLCMENNIVVNVDYFGDWGLLVFAGDNSSQNPAFQVVKLHGKAIPLLLPKNMVVTPNGQYILLSENGRREGLIFQKQALDIIKNIKEPIGAIVLAGRTREGKSYSLSRLVGDNVPADSFHLGHTVEAKTFGIWIWSEPIEMVYGNQKLKVLLIDTEGVDAASANASDDNHIMILSVLLSSLFIYNTTTCPTASSMETLEITTRFTQNIQLKSSNQNNTECNSYMKPRCIWLFRDFKLNIPAEFKTLTSFILNKVCNNDSRKKVIESFETFDTYHMEAPATGCVPDIPYVEHLLNANFIKEMSTFVNSFVPSNIKPKQNMNGGLLDGTRYVTLILLYLKTIKTHGMIPNIEDKFTMVIENTYNKTIEKCVNLYEREMKKHLNSNSIYEICEIRKQHTKTWATILDIFNRDSMFEKDEKILREYSDKLFELIKKERSQIESNNMDKSVRLCEQVRSEMKQNISLFIRALTHDATVQDLEKEAERQMKQFEAQCKGPGREQVRTYLLQDIENLTVECANYLSKLQDYESEKVIQMLEQEQQRLEITKLESEQLTRLQELEDMKLQNEKHLHTLIEQQQAHEQDLNHFKLEWDKKETEIKKEYSSQVAQIHSKYSNQEELFQRKFDELTRQNQDLRTQINNIPRPSSSGGGGGGCVIL
ncbi:predicted protein [Naegleria gruberi]|uniref:Predicted protein n=1 Tax=Naegleria gruberi TaxID=5762 RepID=D2VAU4_NAEGR|nr:uncharacterized protein NAEGRDRAFT_65980 [Naegleria gruberi]EFC46141.1 predicted protein [Naegleria gruberi]|eukprot:XP_002678885.1 predicted protein [Naegleria gruberi strain NEG-M]